MKKILLLLVIYCSTQHLAYCQEDQSNVVSIPSKELKEANCKDDGKKNLNIPKERDAVIQIDFPTETNAKKAVDTYKVFLNGKVLASEKAVTKVSGKSIIITLPKPFDGTDKKENLYKIQHGTICVYSIKATLDEDAPAAGPADNKPPKPASPSKEELLAIAKKEGYTIALNDLLTKLKPNDTNCCDNDKSTNCCYNMNIITYDAKCNKLIPGTYRNRKNAFKNTRPLRVRAGEPLTFRIFNLNPEAYKLDVSDTTEVFFQESTPLLSKFFPSEAGINAANTPGPASDADKLRGGLLLLVENLSPFLRELQFACINHHYKIIDAKIEARRRIDTYLERLGKAPGEMPEQFLISRLDMANKGDSALYAVVKKLYNTLPASYYNLETFYPEVPRNKDVIRYTFNIKARENTPYMDKVVKKDISVYIVRNWKVDVSSGFYYAGDLTTSNYATLSAYDTLQSSAGTDSIITGKRLIKEKSDIGEFGFNSLVHFSYKATPTLAAGIHMGAGISLNDKVTPRYFGGVSLLLGNERGRLNINFGVAMGNIKELSNKYNNQVDDPKQFISASEDITYVKRFKTSYYVGLSYNLPFKFSNRVDPTPKEEDTDKGGDDKGNDDDKNEK